jgi:predicted nucleic-acid-binding protein
MLEAEWVLRACYDIPVGQIALAFEGLLGVPHITMDELNDMTKAIMLYKLGMDFGDAMHLLAGKSAKKYVSFDKKMIKKAVALGINTVALAE